MKDIARHLGVGMSGSWVVLLGVMLWCSPASCRTEATITSSVGERALSIWTSGLDLPIDAPHFAIEPYRLQVAPVGTSGSDQQIKWTDIVVAIFTIVLAMCGIGSAAIAWKQWGALKDQVSQLRRAVEDEEKNSRTRSEETSRALRIAEDHARAALEQAGASKRAAEASELSARGAIGADTPILFIENVEPANLSKGTSGAEWLLHFVPKLVVANYGKTPAFIDQIVLMGNIGTLVGKPNYKDWDIGQDPIVVEYGKPISHEDWLFKFKPNEEESEAFSKGERNFSVYGYVSFEDFMKRKHTLGFEWFWTGKKFLRGIPDPNYTYLKDH